MLVAKQIFSFASYFIENLRVLPNGTLLLSTIVSPGLLYTLNPNANSRQAQQVTTFSSNITAVTGSARIPGHELYAVGGGLHTDYAFANNSMSLFVVSLATDSIVKTIPVPGTLTMNGLVALPNNPFTVLSADSIGGRILRIDTLKSAVDVAFADPALGPGAGYVPPIGVNGLKMYGSYLYFTNSDLATFGRVLVDQDGNKAGAVEIVAYIDGAPDDFCFDGDGNAYIAVHPSSVVKITPWGVVTTIGEGDLFLQPTSVVLANDAASLYVSTGGNGTSGGQILRIWLPKSN
ncbi:hypothetical protein BGW36DRAFT_164629 [Talaromyces proteolyticus]|uniref:SMP-30/Gluconolactonase/LRE-like region domain-containing protein n=1 Tax=Talaromyces proteolyticus TaxID=1131652 RepID=A0AAD4KQS0_9EURO|nr:uncharacterized protein BGW36DRAFT_164629 [Talaromyces proteolyticus]KAH8697264.1 hypothetical protein BGW36DRAFT_164629 [Talaromyces proteolyticus]